MDVAASTPPPGAPQPASKPAVKPAAAKPVGGLKQYDGKRVLARLIDALVVGIPSGIAQTSSDEFGAYWVFVALSLIYFFVCEATLAQTLGKKAMGLRVMTRDGRAPSVNAISDAGPEPEPPGWVPRLEVMYQSHAALNPPAEMTNVHAALLRSDVQLLDAVRKLAAVYPNQKAMRRVLPLETQALHDREVMIKPYLPGCA